MLTRYAQVIV